MKNISLGFHSKRKWHLRDKAVFPSSCTGFSEREKGMSRKWGRKLKKSGTQASMASSPFHLKPFLSPIHSFRSFVCLTDHYNHTQFNGRNVNSLSSCPGNPHVWSILQSIWGSFNVLFCAPVTLKARHLAYNKPHFPPPHACCSFPVAYSDIPSCSSFPACLAVALSPPAWACPAQLLRQTLPGVLAIPYLSSAHTHHPTLGRHIPGSSWLSRPVFKCQSHCKQKIQWQDYPTAP